jgi:hypothetical protein
MKTFLNLTFTNVPVVVAEVKENCLLLFDNSPPAPSTTTMQLQATPIDTRGFQSLLSLVDNTANDSFELYYGLFM